VREQRREEVEEGKKNSEGTIALLHRFIKSRVHNFPASATENHSAKSLSLSRFRGTTASPKGFREAMSEQREGE